MSRRSFVIVLDWWAPVAFTYAMQRTWVISANAAEANAGVVTLSILNEGVSKGDSAFLYREGGKDSNPGIYAVGEVEGVYGSTVAIKVNSDLLSNKRQFIKKTTLLRDPGLSFPENVLGRPGQTLRLSNAEALRLRLLAKKAGKDYDSIDSMRCLLAYEECVQKGLSIDSSEPVRTAALETGRLLTSVAFKLANFRSLDPRTEDAGFEGVAEVDRKAWTAYYDKASKRIDVERLRKDLADKEFVDPDLFIITPEEEQEDLALIQNDEDRRQWSARRVRRGQSRFRKALLTLYNSQCAFTGVTEEKVLEACHVLSHAETGNNQLDNGLILRADIHTLFDLRLATVANDGVTVRIAPKVTDPEFTRLDKTLQRRALVTPEHKAIIALRNQDIDWLS
jgi:hypothetical protein